MAAAIRMFKEERKWFGMDVCFGGNHKHRLESDSLHPDVILCAGPRLSANRNFANGFNILSREAVFVVFDHNLIRVNVELYVWLCVRCRGNFVEIAVSILYQFEYKSRFTFVKIRCQTTQNFSTMDRERYQNNK